jgi:phage gp36-like protein
MEFNDIKDNKGKKDVIYKYIGNNKKKGKIIGYFEGETYSSGNATKQDIETSYVFNLLGSKTVVGIDKETNKLEIEECKGFILKEPEELNIDQGTKIVYKYPMKGWVFEQLLKNKESEQESEQYKQDIEYNKKICDDFIKEKEKDIANNNIIINNEESKDNNLKNKIKKIFNNLLSINKKNTTDLNKINETNNDYKGEIDKYEGYKTNYKGYMNVDIAEKFGWKEKTYCASIIDLIDEFETKFEPGAIFKYDGIDESGLLVQLLVEEQSTDASKNKDKIFLFPSSAFYSPFFEKLDESEIILKEKEQGQPTNGGKRNLRKAKKSKKSKKHKKTTKTKKTKKTPV